MKKKNKKNKVKILEKILIFLPIIVIISILSRSIPDGTMRVNIGTSGVGEKAIAFTFDDGPCGNTEELLDGLAMYDAKATFFLIGKNAEKYPEIVKRAYEEGHLIGNHTYDHIRLPFKSLETCRESIEKTSDILEEITGTRPLFFRAPYGDVSFLQLKLLDTIFVGWSASSYDWQDKSENYIYKRIMEKAEDGEILLFHDTKEATVKAVLRAIPDLQEQGYEIVRVDDLLSRNGEKLKFGVTYRKCEYDKGALIF